MIIYHRTSILESTAKTSVNTVNCVGVMGKGLAQAYKKRYPKMYKTYKKHCDDNLFEPGKLWLWKADDQWILNFPTKKHWRNASKVEWIEAGLQKFVDTYKERGITQISFPKLGCGNGNLDWEKVVRPVMEKYLDPIEIEVYIHDFQAKIGIPEHLEIFSKEQDKQDLLTSGDEVWRNLNHISSEVGNDLVDLHSNKSFRIKTSSEDLMIDSHSDRTFLSKDEVIANWLMLTSGILTKRKIGISKSDQASQIISVFSLLPHVEPIKIGFPNSTEEELAAEVKYTGYATDAKTEDQLSWV